MTAAPPLPSVRLGQRLTPKQLRDAARDLIAAHGLTQAQVAELIGSSQPSVGAALGADYAGRVRMLASIVEALSDRYSLERTVDVRYRVTPKGEAPTARRA